MGVTVAESRTVRVRPVPAYEPPYDDERYPDPWVALVQPQLELPPPTALKRVGRSGSGHADAGPTEATGPTGARPTGTGATGTGGAGTGGAGLHSGPRSLLPGAGTGASPSKVAVTRFLHACLEILNGYRPVAHVRTLSSPLEAATVVQAMTHAVRRLERVRRRTTAPADRRLRSGPVRICEPRPGTAEIAAVIRTGTQTWALAVRLEQRQGRWLCTVAHLL